MIAGKGPLSDMTVVEVGSLVAGPAMGSLLQILGATIIKIEQPTVGDPSRTVSPWGFLNYNFGKRSLSLNLKDKEGQDIFQRLIRTVDILIENLGPGVSERLGFSYRTISQINPRLIYCSVKGFASTSNLRDKPAFDAVAQALSGMMSLTGEPGGEPVRIGNPSVDLGAAAYGTIGVLSSILERQKTGRGTFIEIPLLDMSVYWNGYWLTYFAITGNMPERLGSGHLGYSPHKTFKSRDGRYVFIATLSDAQWDKLRNLLKIDLGREYDKMAHRIRHRSIVEKEVEKAVSELDADQIIALLGNDVPCARVNTVSDVYYDPDLNRRNIIVNTNSGAGKKVGIVLPPLASVPAGSEVKSPRVGEDTDSILKSLGYTRDQIEGFRARKVI